MSRLAVQSNVSAVNGLGASRIPRLQGHVAPSHDHDAFGVMSGGSPHSGRPSRLQQLQTDFQKQIMKEKESKLIDMYEQNQQKALQRVGGRNNKGGMVRDFFNERRNQGSASSSGSTSHLSPSMEHMYKRKQFEHKYGPKSPNMAHRSPHQPPPAAPKQQVNAFGYNPYSQQKSYKSSAGRDRSNPLAPIQRHGQQQQNPFPNKPQIVRPRTYKDNTKNKENLSKQEPVPRSAPSGNLLVDNDRLSDDSPLPNAKQLEALQRKRQLLQSRKSNKSMVSIHSIPEQPSDFQKFQMEQDNQRADRLRRHREKNQVSRKSAEDEGYEDDSEESGASRDELKRKQAELMAQIEAQQRELDKIRQERQREEIEEKKEMERRKRVEEDRRRKQAEEEKRRRRQEDEERIRREHEEERERKLQEEKRRLSTVRQSHEKHHRTKYQESDDYEDEEAYAFGGAKSRKEPIQSRPSPSPELKPAKATQRRHPVPAKTKLTPRQPAKAAVGGEHTAMYEGADRLEGAHEDVGRLKACYNCGRKFAEDRLAKHEAACKNATKKRKVMDPTKVRTQGTEMEQYVRHKQPEPKSTKKNNWRTQHENFVASIRYARQVKQVEEQGGNIADLPPPPASENPDYVQCQYCSRKFNAQAAERHIPHCKNTKARPAAPPKRR